MKTVLGDREVPANVKTIDPLGYLELLYYLSRSEKVLTDSGGLQKEAFFLDKQCVTLRDETEWTETLMDNWNILAGVEQEKILVALNTNVTGQKGDYFGDGKAGEKIVNSLISSLPDYQK